MQQTGKQWWKGSRAGCCKIPFIQPIAGRARIFGEQQQWGTAEHSVEGAKHEKGAKLILKIKKQILRNLHGTCHLLIGLYALSCFLSKFFYDMQTFLGLSDLSVPLWVCAVTQWPFIYGTANIYPMMLVIAVDRMLSVFVPIWFFKNFFYFFLVRYATRNDKFYLPFVYFLSALIPILIL